MKKRTPLAASSINALSLAAALLAAGSVAPALALDLNGTDTTVANLNGAVTDFVTDNSATPGITTLTINGGGVSTYAGMIYDGFSRDIALFLTGNSTLALTGENNYSGGTTLDTGVLQINSAQSLGSTGGLVTINNGTLEILAVAGTLFDYNSFQLAGSGGAIQADTGTTIFFYGSLSDFTSPGTLTKTGAGALFLGGSDYYSGGTLINAGTLQLGSPTALGASTGPLTVNAGTLDLQGNSVTTGALAGAAGTITSTTSGAITLTVGDASSSTFSGLLQNGSANLSLIYAGSGSLTLNHANTYTGGTTLTSGTVIVTNSSSVGAGPVTIHGGTLDLGGDPTANNINFGSRAITIAGAGTDGVSGALVNNGAVAQQSAFQNIILSANATIGGSARFDLRGGAATLTLNNHTLTKTGSNQVSLVGATVTDGSILVNAGILSLETSTSVHDYADGNSITYLGNTTAQFYGSTGDISRPMIFNGSNIVVGNTDLNAAATVDSPMTLQGDITIAPIGGANGNLILNGKISDSGAPHSITKTSTSALTLNGANTYSGGTTLDSGALFINNTTGTATGTGAVTLNGGTLAGSGSAGAVLAGAGPHVIAPGPAGANSVGTLTLASLSTNANTTLSIDLASPSSAPAASDLLQVTGSLSLNGGQLAIASQASAGAASLGYYPVISFGALTGSTSALLLPPIANNIEYTLDPTHTLGFIDLHIGFLGDANDDGTVDLSDLQTVLNNLGAPATSWADGNFDGAPTIDLNDLNDVLNNLGVTIPSADSLVALPSPGANGSAPAPEPATLAIAGTGACALLLRRRRRH